MLIVIFISYYLFMINSIHKCKLFIEFEALLILLCPKRDYNLYYGYTNYFEFRANIEYGLL